MEVIDLFIYLEPLCFSLTTLTILLIVFLIIRVQFSPVKHTQIQVNKLALVPFYLLITYLIGANL